MTRRLHGATLVVAGLLCAGLSGPLQGQTPPFYPAATQGENYMRNYLFAQPASSSPWAPSWSPDGRQLAVGMGGRIWTIDVTTGAATERTTGPGYHGNPDWSPDGRWIVFTVDDGRRTIHLMVLNVATGHMRQLTGLDGDSSLHIDPAFSPDGRRLAYVSTRPAGRFNVYVRAIQDGQWAGPEIPVTTDHTFGRNRLYFGPWDMHITPRWFPNGRELAVVANRGVALGSGNVWRVPVDVDAMSRGRVILEEQTLYRTRPDLSPDGRRFVYASTAGAADEFTNLYVQSTEGGHPYKLTFFDHDAFQPRWSPDGETIAFNRNRDGLPDLWLLEVHGGRLRPLRITQRRWMHRMAGVEVITVDAATGRPTPARLHLTASDGRFHAPPDAFARLSGEGDHLFHTPGRIALQVPVGPLRLVAVKGFEFLPESTLVEISSHSTPQRITLRLRRLARFTGYGWHSGSTHVHANYGGTLHNSLANVRLMGEAEGNSYSVVVVANKDNRILDRRFFAPGRPAHPASTTTHLLLVGQEYRPPFYGHLLMVGMREHLVSPFTTGYEGTAIDSPYPSNTDMLRVAQRQGAVTAYVHAFRGETDPMTFGLGQGKGFLVDAALGTTHAIEWSYASRSAFIPWYAALNAGLPIVAIGGEDAISNMHQTRLLGAMRSYVHTGDPHPRGPAVLAALRGGRGFVTNGPLLDVRVNGYLPGDTVRLPAAGGRVSVRATVHSITPLSRVWLVWNGDTVRMASLSPDRRRATAQWSIPVSRSGWLLLRAEGVPSERFPLDAEYAQAHTNPVWITVGGRDVRDARGAAYGLRWVDSLQAQAERLSGWRTDQERAHVRAQFDAARAVYRRLMAESDGPPSAR